MMSALPIDPQNTMIDSGRSKLPLVTIITVVYNGANVLPKTIDSVAGQTYPNIEYIVIDGASTDGTSEILGRYAKTITTLVQEADQGVYDAMNKGIQLAQGKIIGFLNAGDCYRPAAIEQVVAAYCNLIPLNDTDCVLIAASLEVITSSGLHYFKQPTTWHLDRDLSLPHPSLFITKQVFQRFGLFQSSYAIAGDYDFVLRTYRHCQILLLAEVTTVMAPLGKSANYWLTANEAHRARLKNGFSPTLSYAYLLLKRLRILLHLILQTVGLWRFVEPIGKHKTQP